jgi:signal transduction histidine kinase/ActR/RegA family two-component response regulator
MTSGGSIVVENVINSEIFRGKPSLEVLLAEEVRAVQSTPLLSSAGNLLGMISTHFTSPHQMAERESRLIDLLARQAADYLERKRYEEEREQLLARERAMRASAESANRVKDEFLATVSHELRTPLNAILGWATMIRNVKMDQETIDRANESIERNARSQAQLIEDLLDVSRIVCGKMRLDVRPISLTPIIKAALDSVRPAAEAKQIRLRMTIDSAADELAADQARTQQVVWNLLSNAIKFTPNCGNVEVRTSRLDGFIEITVSDNGEGIPKEFLPFVFDRFQQADNSITRRHGGLGLGLAIARHLVEMHGGAIEASSNGAGLGSTFTVKLPIAAKTDAELPETKPGPLSQPITTFLQAPKLTGIKVLVVDDDADVRMLLRTLLENWGAHVTVSSSARQASEVFAGCKPDVVVCDIGMPEEDGYSFIQRIRQMDAAGGGDVPAIALTGFVRVEDRARALQAGYHMFVPKPVEAAEIISAIESLVERDHLAAIRGHEGITADIT